VDDAKILRSVLDFLSAVGERCPVILPVHPRLRDALGTTKLPVTILKFLVWLERYREHITVILKKKP
jgi:hypothetical protein